MRNMKRNVLRIVLALIMMLGILIGTTTTMTKPVDAACSHSLIMVYPDQIASCTKVGVYKKQCVYCGAILGAIITPTNDLHKWQRVTTISPSSCTRNGVIFCRCIECGKTCEKTTPATGHKMTSEFKEGKYVTYCILCGYVDRGILV